MADYVLLNKDDEGERGREGEEGEAKKLRRKSSRVASLDVFRGLSIALMIFVDYAGSVFPSIVHSPWNGIRLADFVTPFFLFIAGISLSLVYKKISNRYQQTRNAILRALKLFLLGILLQGGYFHGVNSLTFGVDVEKIRWFGILQRIAIGYIIAAFCEIWCSSISSRDLGGQLFKNYYLHWIVAFSLCGIYLGLLYGLYVPDWHFKVQQTPSSIFLHDSCVLKTDMCLQFTSPGCLYCKQVGVKINEVKCEVRGDLGPACNSAGMIDRYVLGIDHLYKKPAYRNLKDCRISKGGEVTDGSPSWCQAPFDPEGILGSLMAAVTCIIGLQYGHILVYLKGHKDRLLYWLLFSVAIFSLGLFLCFIGMPTNKQLYSMSFMLLTTGSAGFTFCFLYLLVDVYGYRCLTFVLQWAGRHSLSIFVLVASNIAITIIQGFYWKNPKNNIVHWIVSLVQK